MRDIDFWNEKLLSVTKKLHRLNVQANAYSYAVERYKNLRMKKVYGHGLNRDYTGYKIQARRALFLKRRLIDITKYRKAIREIKRLNKTKVNFYATKIRELGGAPKDCWGNAIL